MTKATRPNTTEERHTFLITHRLSQIRWADLIVVLERGRIAASGTHAELLRTSGLYAEIYYRQLQPQELRDLFRFLQQ